MTMINGGLNKVEEEAAELIVVCCKIESAKKAGLGYRHYDGTNLKERFIEEAGDLIASLQYTCEQHQIDIGLIQKRAQEKLELFRKWKTE